MLPHATFAISGALSAANLLGRDPLSFSELAIRVPLMIVWVWANLLVHSLSNQRHEAAVIEDTTNKPWRPLPSGRIAPDEARRWLLLAIPSAVGTGMLLGAFRPSLCLMALFWMYDDLDGGSGSIWMRNLLNAAGYMSFSWGALSVMSKDPFSSALQLSVHSDGYLAEEAYWWIWTTGVVVMSTVHAQDMPDIEGDKARDRKTVPLLYGELWARGSLAATVMLTSFLCPSFFAGLATWWAIPPVLLGFSLSTLTMLQWGQFTDEVVWKLWCAWLMSLYFLPLSIRSDALDAWEQVLKIKRGGLI